MIDASVRRIMAARGMGHDAVGEQRLDLDRVDRGGGEDAYAGGVALRVGDGEPFAARERLDGIEAIGAGAAHQIFAAVSGTRPRAPGWHGGRGPRPPSARGE